jgi:hypothetical protein
MVSAREMTFGAGEAMVVIEQITQEHQAIRDFAEVRSGPFGGLGPPLDDISRAPWRKRPGLLNFLMTANRAVRTYSYLAEGRR